jgi:ligand-binding SRPBCC domain-containing protein
MGWREEGLAWGAAARERPRRGLAHIARETVVAAALAETFSFFSDAANLERLTPPSLRFHVVTPMPVEMREGAVIDYRIVLRGLPMRWRTRIDIWEPGVRFVDRQIIGPYRWWRHEHRFEAVPGGTRVIDRVEFVPRLRLLTGWLVRREVERIFTFRQAALERIFGRGR